MNDLTFVSTAWDSLVFGMPTYEILVPDEDALAMAATRPGHYTVKVDPLSSKSLLHRYGFYFCGTLIVPIVSRSDFIGKFDDRASIVRSAGLSDFVDICRGSFTYGRFHRDFNLPDDAADQRYVNWLQQLYREKEVFALAWDGELAAFFACDGNHILLHAVAEKFRGKGLAKYLWSLSCQELFAFGHKQLQSSVSSSNLAVVNLYASLGFRFRGATDIYQRLTV